MIPLKLELENFCQHKHFVLDYKFGLTGITGRNGSGKSNLIHTAQYFAITGKTPTDFIKADLLNWDAGKGWTTFMFTHDNNEYTLKRAVHSNTVNLTWTDSTGEQHKETGARATEYMKEIIGEFDVFYETSFVQQDKLTEILTLTHAHRMAYFQKLTDVRRAEVIRGILQDGINKLPNYLDRSEEIDKAEEDISGIQTELDALSTKQEGFEELKAKYDEALPGAQKILSLPTKEQHESNVTTAQQTMDTATAAKGAFEKESNLQEVEYTTIAPEDRSLYEQWTAYSQALDAVVKAQSERDSIHVREPKPEVEPVAQARIEHRDRVKETLLRDEAKYELCREGTCPTCERPMDVGSADQFILEYERMRDDYDKEVIAITNLQEEYMLYANKVTPWKSSMDAAEKALEDAKAAVQKPEQDFDIVAFEAKKRKAEEYTEYLRKKDQVSVQFKEHERKVIEAQQMLTAAKTAEFAEDKAKEDAQLFQNNYDDMSRQLNEVNTTKHGLDVRLEMLQKAKATLEQEQKQRGDAEELVRLFERARELLHRDNLPKIVMSKMLDGLNYLLDNYLTLFETEFTAYINDDFDFHVSFPHKQNLPVRVLSGGQKVALAIAYHFALNQLLSSSVSMLSLDEPTNHLDDANIQALSEVLQSARRYTEKGVPVLISTHEEALMPAFSSILDVTEKAS
jgi:exonuclease SbcC